MGIWGKIKRVGKRLLTKQNLVSGAFVAGASMVVSRKKSGQGFRVRRK